MEPKTELQKNAIAEARRRELETYQRALDIQWLNSRMEDGRMGRCQALIQKEAEMEKDFQEKTDHAAIVNAKAKRETALGIEIAKIKREEACQLLRRHYLRERDPSLRELIKKLQAGYVCRDLQQQILHNQYKKLQDKVEEDYANRVLLNSLYNDKEAKANEERTKIDKNRKYCLELQQQLVNKQRQKQCEYEDTLIEKKMLDEVLRTIADEDQRELKHKHEQTDKMRKEMVTFKQAREAWKEKQKEMLIIEERKIEEQIKVASDRSSAIIAERERKMREKEEMNHKIAAKILADEASRQERENLIKLLQEQEYLEKNVQDDIAEKNKFELVKSYTKQSLTAQMENRKKLEKEQKEREAEFRKSVEAKLAADDEKEKEKERKAKEKKQIYSMELRQQIQDNAARRRQCRRAARGDHWDMAWQEEVSVERAKIVSEHGPLVRGFLQPGALRAPAPGLPPAGAPPVGPPPAPARRPKCNAQCRVLRLY
ncbi:unnamed protein product, partial [Brenthis ino]